MKIFYYLKKTNRLDMHWNNLDLACNLLNILVEYLKRIQKMNLIKLDDC